MWFHDLRVRSFLALNNIPLFGFTTVYQFTYLRTSWFFQLLTVTRKAAMNICCGGFCVDMSFQLLWANWKSTISRPQSKCMSDFVRNFPTVFQNVAFLPTMNECFFFSTFSSVLGVVSVWDFRHLNRCIMVFHCCFNLQIP